MVKNLKNYTHIMLLQDAGGYKKNTLLKIQRFQDSSAFPVIILSKNNKEYGLSTHYFRYDEPNKITEVW